MQIELIGCTSAGKSTLIKHLLQVCQQQGVAAVTGDDFVLQKFRLNGIKSYFWQRFIVDLLALFACWLKLYRNFKLYLFASKIISNLPGTINLVQKIMITRNFLRNLGVYEIIQHLSYPQEIILLDEGTLHIAHYLFVHVSVEPNSQDLATFAKLIPVPDVAIYLQQQEAVLIERTLTRGHKRIPNNSYAQVERFIKFAVSIFDELIKFSTIKNNLLVVDAERNIHTATDNQNNSSLLVAKGLLEQGIKVNKENINFVDC
ncbi:hypothetical protein H6G41_14695 [Tolypothrix sp. FACHB-123]|uniref:hypothetical protein n=1 Tax=Tolypothrix sp. FACHB-123 TaxID=2692868 RepID=UPI001683CA1E|nr:hypothetical protein [Tolypothrix sp. FACHB-123]MBD2355850.1 hypothetical protein [Tolypothrix sp. FACHB-123]